ncbi:MAG: DUF4494 family protein [Clostridia bacterium]|nr:DUF4494 family protein [Clostridia bacterium]
MNISPVSKFYDVIVSIIIEDDKGREKKTNVKYLIDAVDVIEAENNTTKMLADSGSDYEIISISISKTQEVWVKE